MRKHFNQTLEIRRLTGMSQQETAAMLGISREALALYETRKRDNLPASATLFHGLLLVEMNKPENQPATAPAPGDVAKQKLVQELSHISKEKRYQAQQVQQQLHKCVLNQMQQENRRRALPCIEKVHTQLLAQSNGTPWQPLSQHQQRWLKMAKEFKSFTQANEDNYIEQQLLQLRYNTLMMEATEAERMLAAL